MVPIFICRWLSKKCTFYINLNEFLTNENAEVDIYFISFGIPIMVYFKIKKKILIYYYYPEYTLIIDVEPIAMDLT